MKASTSDTQTTTSAEARPAQPHHDELQEIEQLTNDLKRLLVKHEDTLMEEGIRREVETLERWIESYRRGLSAARKISETGITILSDVRDHLKLAIHERHRLEDEGGSPSSKDDNRKIDDLAETMHHIESMLPDIGHIFPVAEPEHEDA